MNAAPSPIAARTFGPWPTMAIVVAAMSALYAWTWTVNGLFLDMDYYFKQFEFQRDEGWLASMAVGVVVSGKLEVGIYQIFQLLIAAGVASEFWVLFWMFAIMQAGIWLAVRRHFSPALAPATLVLILLSHFSISQNFYFWRQVLAVAVVLLACRQPNWSGRLVLALLAVSFHYSALVLIAIYVPAAWLQDRSTTSLLAVAAAVGIVTWFARSYAGAFAATEQDEILFESTPYVLFILASVAGAAAIFAYVHHVADMPGRRLLCAIGLLACCMAFAGASSNLFIIRAFTPASLLLPYVVASLPMRLALPILLVTAWPGARLLFKILAFGDVVGDL